MKRTFIRIMFTDVNDIDALKIKQEVESLVADIPNAAVEFTITEVKVPSPIPILPP